MASIQNPFTSASRLNRAGLTCVIFVTAVFFLLPGGCAAKKDPALILPSGAKVTVSPVNKSVNETVASGGGRTVAHPETASVALKDPNVPAAAKAMIQAHMGIR